MQKVLVELSVVPGSMSYDGKLAHGNISPPTVSVAPTTSPSLDQRPKLAELFQE